MSAITNPLASQPTGTTDSSSQTPPSNQLTGNSFIQLLSAQLQAQDPLDPIDPTTFVTQLVQFNQLEQLIDINQTLSGTAAASTGSTPTSSPQTAAAIAKSNSAASVF
jgi:flagellar basal-body rod modification protein FlgD